MKRILVDGTVIAEHMDGLSQYVLNVVPRLKTEQMEITMLVRPGYSKMTKIENMAQNGIKIEEVDISPIGCKRDLQMRQWFHLHTNEFDAVLFPSNQFPFKVRIPSVYVIHDIIYEEFPQQLGRLKYLKRFFLHHVVRRGLRSATKVVCVSNYTKQEVLRVFPNCPKEKLLVFGEGWEHLAEVNVEEQSMKIPPKYLLYLGSSRGHKNVLRLLKAVEKDLDIFSQNNCTLVVTGNTCNYGSEEKHLFDKLYPFVQTTGWMQSEQVGCLLKHAEALVFPSLSEGFGIPLLEAFYNQVPVLCSNRASLPEVAKDAALYFDPFSIDDMAEKISQFIENRVNKEELINAGNKRLETYSWQKAANNISDLLMGIAK